MMTQQATGRQAGREFAQQLRVVRRFGRPGFMPLNSNVAAGRIASACLVSADSARAGPMGCKNNYIIAFTSRAQWPAITACLAAGDMAGLLRALNEPDAFINNRPRQVRADGRRYGNRQPQAPGMHCLVRSVAAGINNGFPRRRFRQQLRRKVGIRPGLTASWDRV